MAYVYFLIICLLFGSNFKLMDVAAQVLGPFTIGVARLLGGASVLVAVLYFSKHRIAINGSTLAKIAFVSLLANAFPFAMQPALLRMGVDHSFLAVFVPFTPLLTIIAAVPMLGMRPTWQQIVGVVGGLTFLLVFTIEAEAHNLPLRLLPLVVCVPLSYAIGNTFMRQNLQHVPGIVVSTLLLTIAGFVLLPLAINELWSNPPHASPDEWRTVILALLVLGPLGTGACIGMFVELVQDRGPLFAGMVTYVVPLVALVWGYRDGETVTTAQLSGVVGILLMVALVQSSQANYAVARERS